MRHRYPLLMLLAAAACTADNAGTARTGGDTANGGAAATDDAASRQAVEGVRSGWKEAADRKDSTAIAAFYTDDAVLATSNSPVSNGRAAIERSIGRLVNLTRVTGIDSKALVVMGNDAYDYGTYTQEVPGPGGAVTTSTGYYIVTLGKQSDGSWKIMRHVATIPPAAP